MPQIAEQEDTLTNLQKKFQMRDRRRQKVRFGDEYPLLNPDIPIQDRYKGKRRPLLNVQDKVEILYKMLVEYEYQEEVAKEFRVSKYVV